jgi:Spy/CpxP family protein refolding chaperone
MLTNKRKAQLIIGTTFLLGVIVGASGQYLITHQSMVKPPDQYEEMARAVKLTTDQRARVDQILSETRQQYQDLRIKLRPQYKVIQDASRQRIRDLLTPEQQALYDQWNRELDAKREREQKAKDEAATKGAK